MPETEPKKRLLGRIIKVDYKKGWGFITSKELKFTRIFFHWTALQHNTLTFEELKVGMNVEFTPLRLPDKGYRGVKINVVQEKKDEMPALS